MSQSRIAMFIKSTPSGTSKPMRKYIYSISTLLYVYVILKSTLKGFNNV